MRGSGWRTPGIVRLGVAMTPQGDAIFPGLTGRQHLDCGAWSRRAWKERAKRREAIFDLFPPLRKLENTVVGTLSAVGSRLADARDMFELARDEDDAETLSAVEADLDAAEERVADLEFRRMFNNPADPNNCFIDIQAGAGGTEACDWASMLLRQYLKYAERKGFKATVEDETPGDTAGIKSATIKVEGEYALSLIHISEPTRPY